MWPFDRDKRELANILGPAAAPWLDGAEIAAWTPDPNYKSPSYFVVRDMSEDDFRAWATAADLRVSDTPSVPSGVFVLPAGVEVGRWLGHTVEGSVGVEGQGTTSRASIWSRWYAGVTYTVVRPAY